VPHRKRWGTQRLKNLPTILTRTRHPQAALPRLDLRWPIRYKAHGVPGAGWLTVNGMMRLELPVGDGARVDVPNVIQRERSGPRVS